MISLDKHILYCHHLSRISTILCLFPKLGLSLHSANSNNVLRSSSEALMYSLDQQLLVIKQSTV